MLHPLSRIYLKYKGNSQYKYTLVIIITFLKKILRHRNFKMNRLAVNIVIENGLN